MLHPTGTLVWAKQRTYPPWPAIVAPNTSGKTQKTQRKKSFTHVIFLEYNEEHAWVPTKNIAEFTGAKDDERNIKRVKTAVDAAISMMEINIDDRLIVVTNGEPVVRREGATNMQREVSRNGEDVSDHENDEAVAVNKNGRKKARVEKGVTPNRPEGSANMQHEVGRNGEDVSVHENDEAVAVNKNGRNMPEGAANMQQEVGRNDKDDVSDHENTEPVKVNDNRRNKVRKEKSVDRLAGATNTNLQSEVRRNAEVVAINPYYRPEGSTNANNRRNSPPHAQTSKTVDVTFNIKMEEDTWFKTLEIAPKFMEMASKYRR